MYNFFTLRIQINIFFAKLDKISSELKRTKEYLTGFVIFELNKNKNELKRTEEFLTKELNDTKEELKKTETNLRIYNEFWTNMSSNLETGISYTKLIYP